MKSIQILIASIAVALVNADEGQQGPAPSLCGKGLPPCPGGTRCEKLDRSCIDPKNQGNCIGSCQSLPVKQPKQPNPRPVFGQPAQPPGGFQAGFPQAQPPRGPQPGPGSPIGIAPPPQQQQPQPLPLQQPPRGQPLGGMFGQQQPKPANQPLGGMFGSQPKQPNQPFNLGIGQPRQPAPFSNAPPQQGPPPSSPFPQSAPKYNPGPGPQQPGGGGLGGILSGLFGPKTGPAPGPGGPPGGFAPGGPSQGPPPPGPLAQGAPPPSANRVDPIPIKQCPSSVRCSGRNVCVPSPISDTAYMCVSADEDCGTWKNKRCTPGKACLADPRYTCERGWCQGRDGICVVPPN